MTHAEYKKAVGQYLAALPSSNKSGHTQTAYKAVLSAFDAWMDKNADEAENGAEIGKLTVVAWRSALAEQNSTNTVHHKLVCLHRFFVWAEKMGLCTVNPVDVDEIPQKKEVEYDLLTFEEIQTLLVKTPKNGIHSKSSCRNRAIMVLLCMSGLRNSELRHLRLSDMDFENGTITVRHGKGDKSRTVAFPSLARTAVQDYLASGLRPESVGMDGLLFGTNADENGHTQKIGRTDEWHEITRQGLLGMVNRYTEKCCGHKVNVHALRHAAASLWDHLNITPSEMQQALGHASITTTMGIYRHVLKSDKAAQSINNAFDAM
jgi:integrase/recombinase XerD